MRPDTLLSADPPIRAAPRPGEPVSPLRTVGAEWLFAAVLVAGEAVAAAAGARSALLAAAVLVLAPGLALCGLLPAAIREQPLTRLAALPTLGFAASSVALVTVARLGIPLTGVSVRLTVAALVAAGLLVAARSGPRTGSGLSRTTALEAAGIALALALGAALQSVILGRTPIPGNDWAKYLLYGDEIRRHGSLLIDNPYWMLGVPFREDPGVPSLYGATLIMSGEPAGVLARGIWVFAVCEVLALYAYARAQWGALAGVAAALLAAVIPIGEDILSWHGLANVAALALMTLLMAYATAAVQRPLERREIAGLGIILVAIGAAHRLTAIVAIAMLAILLVVAAARGARFVWATAARGALAAALIGAGVAADLIARQRTFGGTLSYRDYLDTRLDLMRGARDLSYPLLLLALPALGLAVVRIRRDRALWPPVALLAVTVALTYAWIVHLPLSYLRMVYFAPLALVPLAAFGLAQLRPRALGLAVLAVATVAITVPAWDQAHRVKRVYTFADDASLRGLDTLAPRLRPGEIVVTDRCWSFLATWLLHTRTLPALTTADIQPKAELARAREAQGILDGVPAAVRRARAMGIRYLIVDPACLNPKGDLLPPPLVGRPVFYSQRLAILRL